MNHERKSSTGESDPAPERSTPDEGGRPDSDSMTQPGDDQAKGGIGKRRAEQASHRGDDFPASIPEERVPGE